MTPYPGTYEVLCVHGFALQITRSPGKVFELRRGLPKCPQELQEAKPC